MGGGDANRHPRAHHSHHHHGPSWCVRGKQSETGEKGRKGQINFLLSENPT